MNTFCVTALLTSPNWRMGIHGDRDENEFVLVNLNKVGMGNGGLVLGRVGRKARGSLARLVHGQLGSARNDLFEFFHELS
jgi:hypothetical protein